MKNNLLTYTISLFLTMIAFTSCEDEDKNPQFVEENPENFGVFVTLAQETLVIDFTNPESTYDFTITAPAENVAEYRLSVVRTSGESVSDTVFVESANSFPANFSISTADLANALSIPTESLSPGDRFDFVSEATGINGEVADFSDLNGDATGPGQFQGFNHTTFLSCPFVASDAVGSYTVTTATSPGNTLSAGDSFEIVAGPDESTVTAVGLYPENFDITVDTETGIATVARQPIIPAFNTFPQFPGGNINTSATSFFFSCTGAIVFTVQYTVDAGSFGSGFVLSAQKN